MAMVAKNNMEGIRTLNTLNKNSGALAKSLKKVSSGMRINGAADDASGYAISERMRAQILSLDQANQNTQSGMSLMRTAEGAVASTVEILRTLKEKAIDAANDTNTDADRAIIQKELEQAIDQVDDNALVTYNGKYLLDGSAELPSVSMGTAKEAVVRALYTEWLPNTLDKIQEAFGLSFEKQEARIRQITVHLDENVPSSQANALAWVTTGRGKLELHVNMDYFGSLDRYNVDGANAGSAYNLLDRTIAHEMTHGIMASCVEGFTGFPLVVIEGVAEIIHGADERFFSGDTGATLSGSFASIISVNYSSLGSSGVSSTSPYIAGYTMLRYMAHGGSGGAAETMKRFMQDLAVHGSLDHAVSAATNGAFASYSDLSADFQSSIQAAENAAATNPNARRDFLEQRCGILLDYASTNPDQITGIGEDTGSITGSDARLCFEDDFKKIRATSRQGAKSGHDVIPEAGSTKFWYAPNAKTSIINGLEVVWTEAYTSMGGITFQTGSKANQSIRVRLMDMRADALGLRYRDPVDGSTKKLSVETQQKANGAIHVLDQALTKALDQQTTIGSIQSRLEHTSSNLTVASENARGSESTIRDADMAREMTDYTKNGVLLQASQSMLAQANQNLSSVLSLLQ